MITLPEYLATLRENCPEWLVNFDIDNPVFNREDFFNSRVVFYPGAYVDGHAIRLFGSSHAAHCFVYCDYWYEQNEIRKILDGHDTGYSSTIKGYYSLARIELRMHDLVFKGWTMHIDHAEQNYDVRNPSIKPYAFVEILERNSELDDQHGAHRLAILFLGSDGHATYDALFCQDNGHLHPFCLFLQDHGFGGNYSDFGKNGLMHKIANRTGIYPDWLIASTNTNIWDGFQMIHEATGDCGGMNAHLRRLYKKSEKM